MKLSLALLLALMPLSTEAFAYTRETITRSYHEAPASFGVSANGEATGATVSGIPFRQVNVSNDLGIRLQRFEIGTARWYVSDRGVLWATSDLEALSHYLNRS